VFSLNLATLAFRRPINRRRDLIRRHTRVAGLQAPSLPQPLDAGGECPVASAAQRATVRRDGIDSYIDARS
jgi:hypothetical protein